MIKNRHLQGVLYGLFLIGGVCFYIEAYKMYSTKCNECIVLQKFINHTAERIAVLEEKSCNGLK